MGKTSDELPVAAKVKPYRDASTVFAVLSALTFLVFSIIAYVQIAGHKVYANQVWNAAVYTSVTGFFFLLWTLVDIGFGWYLAKRGSTLPQKMMFEGAYEHHAENLRVNRAVKWGVLLLWAFVLAVLWIPVTQYGTGFEPSQYGYVCNTGPGLSNTTLCELAPLNVTIPLITSLGGAGDVFGDLVVDPVTCTTIDRCAVALAQWFVSSIFVAIASLVMAALVFQSIVAYQSPDFAQSATVKSS
jgi:hypothetical protein